MTLPALINTPADDSGVPDPRDHLQYEIGQLEKLRKQIFSDMESLRSQEANLRAYESRLREAHSQPGPVAAGAARGDEEMHALRDKYTRAHALLEAERRSLCDERIAVREQAEALKVLEGELKRREAWVSQKETQAGAAVKEPKKRTRFSDSPFAAAREFLNIGRKGTAT